MYQPPATAQYQTPTEAIVDFLKRSVTPQPEEAIVSALVDMDFVVIKSHPDSRRRAAIIKQSIAINVKSGRLLRSKNGLISLND